MRYAPNTIVGVASVLVAGLVPASMAATGTTRIVHAAGATTLAVPPTKLSCSTYRRHGIPSGVRFAASGTARAVRVQLRKPNSTLHYAERTLRPSSGTSKWLRDELHGRGCGRTYEIRYTVLTGAQGSSQDATHHYGPYKVVVAAS